MEKPSNVNEYWFLKYYRVLVIEEDDKKIVSVDVYKKDFTVTSNTVLKCIDDKNYCIMYRELSMPEYRNVIPSSLRDKVKKVVVVGVKAKDKLETINVRYVVHGDLKYSDVEELFYTSWKLIKCSPPREEELP